MKFISRPSLGGNEIQLAMLLEACFVVYLLQGALESEGWVEPFCNFTLLIVGEGNMECPPLHAPAANA